jgi:hypothetical protein
MNCLFHLYILDSFLLFHAPLFLDLGDESICARRFSSCTRSSGNAGSVIIDADGLKLEDSYITSTALPKSQGYIDDITINSGAITFLNGCQINIKAHQTLPEDRLSDMPDHSINISTGRLNLDQNSHITVTKPFLGKRAGLADLEE